MAPVRRTHLLLATTAVAVAGCAAGASGPAQLGNVRPDDIAASTPAAESAMARRVEIVRTDYGVPHVYAEDLEAFGFAMGWLQLEDYGQDVARALVQARGEYALHVGRDSIGGDFDARDRWLRAVETHGRLDADTRAVYAGFAAGVNHYIRMNPSEFPGWMEPDFTAYDAHARDIQSWSRGDGARIVRALGEGDGTVGLDAPPDDDAFLMDGSNAWALAPSRTTSGNAILLRNPHLAWGAGYYEAHAVVPGHFDFYGDFRIGGAFGIIGGFNQHLGWATTNNYPTYSQSYRLQSAPGRPDHYLMDGREHPVETRTTTVRYRTESGDVREESRTTRWTDVGPVIHERDGWLWVLKDPRHGEYRRGEQFLRMMEADHMEEWLDVMRMRAHPSSNFTYADADGNIVLYWNAAIPLLPHAPTGDTAAVAYETSDTWTELVPWEDLPLYVNPPGGYVQQANDTPDYTNMFVPMDRDTMPTNLPPRRLRLRSQHSLALVHETGPLSLEDVVARKHSPRMLLAERTTDELLAALDGASSNADERTGADILREWDRTADADSRGAVLFEAWWDAYTDRVPEALWYAQPWSPLAPTSTPRGIGDTRAAVTAFSEAVSDLRGRGLALDVPWGDVHRVVRGGVDAPVSGCPPTLGCFRVLSYETLPDGRRAANRGDGWVFAVEFGDEPRAYSVLAYGQSAREDSPHFDDQAAMFARGEMKPVRWTRADVDAHAIRRYRPGRGAGR